MPLPTGRAPEKNRNFGGSHRVPKLTVPEEWHRRRRPDQTLDCSEVKPVVKPGYIARTTIPLKRTIEKFGGSETAAVPREKPYRSETEKLVESSLWSSPEKPAGRIIPLGSKTPTAKYEVYNVSSAATVVEPKKIKLGKSSAAAVFQPNKIKRVEFLAPAAAAVEPKKIKRIIPSAAIVVEPKKIKRVEFHAAAIQEPKKNKRVEFHAAASQEPKKNKRVEPLAPAAAIKPNKIKRVEPLAPAAAIKPNKIKRVEPLAPAAAIKPNKIKRVEPLAPAAVGPKKIKRVEPLAPAAVGPKKIKRVEPLAPAAVGPKKIKRVEPLAPAATIEPKKIKRVKFHAAAIHEPKKIKRVEPLAPAAVEPTKVKQYVPWELVAAKPSKVKRIRIKFNGKETVRYLEKETWRQRLDCFNEFRQKVRDRDENLYCNLQKILKGYRSGDHSVEETYVLISELLAEHYDLQEEFGWECTSFLTPVAPRSP